MKKTWLGKMADKKNFPKVLKLEKRFPCYNAVHKMGANVGDPVVLVNPSEILPIMSGVPKGKLITIWEICQAIAKKHQVKGCCSLTTGIFITTIANAVEETLAKNKLPRSKLARYSGASPKKFVSWSPSSAQQASQLSASRNEKSFLAKVPYWRTLKADGFLNEKYPGGQETHKNLLEKEGFKIIARGKKYQVADWQKYL